MAIDESQHYGQAPWMVMPEGPVQDDRSDMIRERPEIPEARRRLVARIQEEIRADKAKWAPDFKRMKEDMEYAHLGARTAWFKSGKYVANLVQRHVNGKVSAIYAKNPKTVVRRKKRRDFKFWDGSIEQMNVAMQTVAAAGPMIQQAEMMGATAMLAPQIQIAMQILQDAAQGMAKRKEIDGIAETLELLHAYFVGEQNPQFKRQMKQMVRRAVTAGVGYVKLGFQRRMEFSENTTKRIAELETRLAGMTRIAKDIQDNEITEDDPEAEALRLQLQALKSQPDVITYEGLVYDFPQPTAIIPSRFCYQLDGFLGAPMVHEEIPMTVDEIKAVFNVDLSHASFTPYYSGNPVRDKSVDKTKCEAMVYVTYNKDEGLVYVTVDGYEDFLREPAPPEIKTDRFWPWYTYTLNDVADPNTIFPPSDVRLLMPMQDEYNRARQALREHRKAALPAWVTRRQALTDEDVQKLQMKPVGAVLELDGLQPTQKVEDLLQPLKSPAIDPALYDTSFLFDDFQRVGGSQEANLGGISGGTATESSIAESSRMSGLQSNIDDLDDMLSQLARGAGQILLSEMSEQQVIEIVGPGAVWPEMTVAEISKEIYLEIEAGSSGRPNKTLEMQNWKAMAPILQSSPGVKPSWFVRETIRRLDDRLEFSDAYDDTLPSMMMLNRMKQMTAAQPDKDPNNQGGEGSDNGQKPPGDQSAGPESDAGLQPQMDGGAAGGMVGGAGMNGGMGQPVPFA